jgi:hypothetical protein
MLSCRMEVCVAQRKLANLILFISHAEEWMSG